MKLFIFALLILLPTATIAQGCDPSDLPKNGIWYSPTGEPHAARKIQLSPIGGTDQSAQTALSGKVPDAYSADGVFFIRSGVEDEDWLGLGTPFNKDALLVRRATKSTAEMQAAFVSLFREALGGDICKLVGTQKGTNGRLFVEQADYLQFHASEKSKRTDRLLKTRYHFKYGEGQNCRATHDVRDLDGADMAAQVFNGTNKLKFSSAGDSAVRQTVVALASIVIPPPAYASLPDKNSDAHNVSMAEVSSIEASLHPLLQKVDKCIVIKAPTPTARLAGFWAALFSGDEAHQRAALRLAKKGKWHPTQTRMQVVRLRDARTVGLIRLEW